MAAARAVLDAAGVAPSDVSLVLHGTTLATNAIIERKGAKTALICTEGHRDSLEIAWENRFAQYDLSMERRPPLAPRELRLPVTERVDFRGEVLTALDEGSVASLVPVLREAGVESLAIGLLHAYANPAHERRVAEILAEALPEVSLTLSSEVCPEIREYERQSTACANAYVRPLMARYLDSVASRLAAAGIGAPCLMMTSGGNLVTLETAARFPVRLIESGPAGGAILAAAIARDLAEPRVVSFDMGGTTAKICLIDDFEPMLSRSFEVDRAHRFMKGSGMPVKIPVVEMVEIGAGGGSIASVDTLGRINVGPESAVAEPGPASYGRGGPRRRSATMSPRRWQLTQPRRFPPPPNPPPSRGRAQLARARAMKSLSPFRGRKTCGTAREIKPSPLTGEGWLGVTSRPQTGTTNKPRIPSPQPRASSRSSTRTWRRRRGCTRWSAGPKSPGAR
jgi:N-methylhydantoinase A